MFIQEDYNLRSCKMRFLCRREERWKMENFRLVNKFPLMLFEIISSPSARLSTENVERFHAWHELNKQNKETYR